MMNINGIYTEAMYYEYEFCKIIVILFLLTFLYIVITDILKWRFYGRK